MIRRFELPITERQEIDLYSACNELKSCDLNANFEPSQGFYAIHIKFGESSFRVFGNGVVTFYGVMPFKKQQSVLSFFWQQHLRRFVVKKL